MALFKWFTTHFRWEYGRQKTGYRVMTLFYSRHLRCDCYLLRYIKGDSIPVHKDTVSHYVNHFRLNIVLRNAKEGGEFEVRNALWKWWRVVLFRPDEEPHSVSEIKAGERWVLSFGWVRKKR